MKILITLLAVPTFALSFTLTSAGRGFDKNKIKIHIAKTDCSNAGFSTERFRDMIEDAVDDFWNQVASADLKLSVGQVGTIDIDGFDHASIFTAGLIPANSILAGCNEDAFAAASGSLGATQLECDGSTCRAVFIINARPDSLVSTLSRSEQVATIAHELGHAIGLGHSEYSHNLMYYKIGGKTQNWFGQDDIEGVTYLYPHEPPAGCDFLPLFGSMGTIKDISDDLDPPGGFPATIALGFAVIFALFKTLASLRAIIYLKA